MVWYISMPVSFIIFSDEELILKRLVALEKKNEHHSDFGFNQQPSHPCALERIFHSHKCRTSKATSGSMKLVGNFENFWSPAMGWWASLKENHMFLCLSDTGSPSLTFWRENYEKPGRSPRSYSLGSTGRTDSCSLSCERPDSSGTETGSQVEHRTSTDPTFDRTMRRSHPTGTIRPADFSEENNTKKKQ